MNCRADLRLAHLVLLVKKGRSLLQQLLDLQTDLLPLGLLVLSPLLPGLKQLVETSLAGEVEGEGGEEVVVEGVEAAVVRVVRTFPTSQRITRKCVQQPPQCPQLPETSSSATAGQCGCM